MTSTININADKKIKDEAIPFEVVNEVPSKELLEALSEVDEMVNNPKKYPRYNNWRALEKALLSDD